MLRAEPGMRAVQSIGRVDVTERYIPGGQELVTTLVKGLDVLALLSTGELLGNQQIAERAGLSKATASRLCATLTAMGYLRLDQTSRKYAMGARMLGLGATVQHRCEPLRLARQHMASLAHQTGMVVGMGTRDRLGMVCLDVAHDEGLCVGTTSVGSVLPMVETALGLAYLSHVGVAERAPLLRQLQIAYGPEWNRVRYRIEEACAQYQRQGFVIRPLSCEAGVSAVAAAMKLPGNLGVMAFNCATDGDAPEVTARLQRAGARLLSMLNGIARGQMP